MNRPRKLPLKSYLKLSIWLIIAAIWALILAKQPGHSSASVKNRLIPVANLTQSVDAVRVGRVKDNQFTITIRNISNKTIENLAYSFDPQKGLNSSNWTIPPGSMQDVQIGMNPQILNVNPNPVLTILAVTFDDASAEGASDAVETLLDEDLGMNMGILAVGPIIESLCEQPYEKLPDAIGQAKEEMQRILVPPEGRSSAFKAAFQAMVNDGVRKADQLAEIYGANGEDVVNSRLSHTKDEYHTMSSAAKVSLDRFKGRAGRPTK